MEAPDVNLDSDEDSADEDSGGLIDNLTGRQLRVPGDAVLASGDRIGREIEECQTEEVA